MNKNICILGSTGSIGTQTLDVIRKFPSLFKVECLTAHSNIDLIIKQIEEFSPSFVSVNSKNNCDILSALYPTIRVSYSEAGILEAIEQPKVDTVVVGIVGFAALKPVIRAIELGKRIALANKESLVVAGHLIEEKVKKSTALVIPVDSEHNALFQIWEENKRHQIRKAILTASGGPFFKDSDINFKDVTPEQAIKHPNWKMGAKISVDSATLMNKGLELIEAHYLFKLPAEQLDAWIHPQSIVHAMTWNVDNTYVAHMSFPDMRAPIAYALSYPERLANIIEPMSLIGRLSKLEFFEVDKTRFPSIDLALHALKEGPHALIAFNSTNEIAVDLFLKKQIRFDHIALLVEMALTNLKKQNIPTLHDVFEFDSQSRRWAVENFYQLN